MTGRHQSRPGRRSFVLILALAFLMALATFFAPKYLYYADAPVKSDAVVLFVGPGFWARQMEAMRMVEEGYADYILIPFLGIAGTDSSAILGVVNFRYELSKYYKSDLEDSTRGLETPFRNGKLPVQNTHLEILEAKRMMEERGLKSALLVSSPYHMRRIKIIAKSVFGNDGKYVLSFVPTGFEKLPAGLSGLCRYAYESIIQEYLKIGCSWLAHTLRNEPYVVNHAGKNVALPLRGMTWQ